MIYNIKKLFILIFILVNFKHFFLNAEEIVIISEKFPAETEQLEGDGMGGFAGEIITQAFKLKKINYKVKWEHWKIAQQQTLANKDKNIFILPLTRNSEREKKYSWVVKLYDADTVFLTKKGNNPLNSLKEAKDKKIGVLLGSSY